MQARQFEQVLTQLVKLTRRQRDRLLGLLAPAVKRDETAALIEQCTAMRLVCAGRTCNGLTGTPLARLRHKERWLAYLSGMLGSTSIRRAADQLGVTGATTFRWRHRFLALTKTDRPSTLGGITEADEMYLLESHKGARNLPRPPRKRGGIATKRGISTEQMCILIARDRTGQTLDWVPGKGPVTRQQLHEHLKARLEPDVLLLTDGHAAYRSFAREAGITHEAVNLQAGVRVRGALHVQNVNAYHSRLRGWLQPFRGVASRYLGNYLGNYLGCRWALDGERIGTPALLLRAALGAGRAGRFNT